MQRLQARLEPPGELAGGGVEIKSRTTTPGGLLLTAASDDDSRTLNVMASREGSETRVAVQFTEKNR